VSQRQPRIEDAAWLAEVRKMPCTICQRPGPNDPAHLRSAARQYGKRLTGMAEKPDDKWVLPLCRTHHDDQHRNHELRWWARQGIADPFALAIALYAKRPVVTQARPERAPILRRAKPTRPRKPKAERRAVSPGRPLVSRSTFPPKGTRKIATRKDWQ
jgi:hypothetical protein